MLLFFIKFELNAFFFFRINYKTYFYLLIIIVSYNKVGIKYLVALFIFKRVDYRIFPRNIQDSFISLKNK